MLFVDRVQRLLHELEQARRNDVGRGLHGSNGRNSADVHDSSSATDGAAATTTTAVDAAMEDYMRVAMQNIWREESESIATNIVQSWDEHTQQKALASRTLYNAQNAVAASLVEAHISTDVSVDEMHMTKSVFEQLVTTLTEDIFDVYMIGFTTDIYEKQQQQQQQGGNQTQSADEIASASSAARPESQGTDEDVARKQQQLADMLSVRYGVKYDSNGRRRRAQADNSVNWIDEILDHLTSRHGMIGILGFLTFLYLKFMYG